MEKFASLISFLITLIDLLRAYFGGKNSNTTAKS